ncbi:MAG: hypothetical protein IIT90_00290, partial [Clostridiales bacterium]|nr:hypothetical protein [Clostridiales bacterium]
LTNPCENLYVCSTGLTKYATNDTPENHMDSVVSLAGKISSEIIRSYEDSLLRKTEAAPVTELNTQEIITKDSFEGVLS